MKQYELTVVIHPDLEMNLTPALDKIKKLIEDNGGKITKEENEGKKRLGYPIKKQEFGVYYYYEIDLTKEASDKISSVLYITDEVLRFLMVTVDERKKKYAERMKAMEKAEEEKEVEE